MIKLIKGQKSPELGDILFGEEYPAEFISSKIDWKNQPIFFLEGIGYNTWEVLQVLNIDFLEFQRKVLYEDIFLQYRNENGEVKGNRYFWFYPIGIRTKDLMKYAKTPYGTHRTFESISPWVFDAEFMEMQKRELRLSQIAECSMGHGYTNFTHPMDGSSRIDWVAIDMDNGDQLICAAWIWYNK